MLFDDTWIVVKALERAIASWITVLSTECSDSQLGERVLQAWDFFVGVDPNEVDTAAVEAANGPLLRLFAEDAIEAIRSVAVIYGRARIIVPPTELKDENRVVLEGQRFAIAHESSADEIGAAVREAMAMTLS